MNIKTDLFPIFRRTALEFVEYYNEVGDMYTFVFKPKAMITWIPGQHAMFFLKHKIIKNSMHIFSVISTPDENKIMFTTRINNEPSEYKKTLLSLHQGDSLTMLGPIASFYLKNKKPKLLLAAGIGITPFRAILHDIHHYSGKKPDYLKLLYLDTNQEYAYKSELDQWNDEGDVAVEYLNEKEVFYSEIIEFATLYKNNAVYLLSGPKSFVKELSRLLRSNEILVKNIKKDSFIGY
jgi:ferredoxin-NADP reductase